VKEQHVNEPVTTVIGNITEAPELRFTPSGVPVAKFRILQTPRRKNAAGEFEDGDPFGVNVTVWREMAENLAESDFQKGARLIVFGRLSMRQYEDKEGNKRTSFDMDADAVGPDLRWATAKVTKVSKGGGNGAAKGDDEWASASKTRPAATNGAASPAQTAKTERNAPAGQAAAPPSDDW
jgi:single-strand DNA-binding protein